MSFSVLRAAMSRAAALPPELLLRKTTSKVERETRAAVQRVVDRRRPSLSVGGSPGRLNAHPLSPPAILALRREEGWVRGVTANYLRHTFDILGSGWMPVDHGVICRGFEGYVYPPEEVTVQDGHGAWLDAHIDAANLPESRKIWSLIGTPGYSAIDWQRDFRSGWRWSERTWYRDIRWGHRPGVDVKVPWELARMQHLLHLAWAYALASDGARGFAPAGAYRDEFRNQVLDFMATNPPRFGTNWSSPMEVAIRASNWALAYRIFRGFGASFDETFESLLERSLRQHGEHVAANLEWAPDLRGNHYLANVVGLVTLGAILPADRTTDGWLAIGARELVLEVSLQFNPDGTNFEASTCYHRFAAEMVVFGIAEILGIDGSRAVTLERFQHGIRRPGRVRRDRYDRDSVGEWRGGRYRFPGWVAERVAGMREFTRAVAMPDGRAAQIGDNDDGRFHKPTAGFRLFSTAEARALYANLSSYAHLPDPADYWAEDSLCHGHIVDAIDRLVEAQGEDEVPGTIDAELVGTIARRRKLSASHQRDPLQRAVEPARNRRSWESVRADFAHLGDRMATAYDFEIGNDGALNGLQVAAFPDFGLYIWKSDRLFLSVRCGSVGQWGVGGHAHNDQLSIVLTLEGRDLVSDPGTYVYTAHPGSRNAYRSVFAHFAPSIGEAEPAGLDAGLFRLGEPAEGRCLHFGAEGFLGTHSGYGVPVFRWIGIETGWIRIRDFCEEPCKLNELPVPAFPDGPGLSIPVSPGYGKLMRTMR